MLLERALFLLIKILLESVGLVVVRVLVVVVVVSELLTAALAAVALLASWCLIV